MPAGLFAMPQHEWITFEHIISDAYGHEDIQVRLIGAVPLPGKVVRGKRKGQLYAKLYPKLLCCIELRAVKTHRDGRHCLGPHNRRRINWHVHIQGGDKAEARAKKGYPPRHQPRASIIDENWTAARIYAFVYTGYLEAGYSWQEFNAEAGAGSVMDYLGETRYQYLLDNDLLKFVSVKEIHAHHSPHVDLKTGMCSVLERHVKGIDANVHQKNCHMRRTRDGERPTDALLMHILEDAEHALNIDDSLLEEMQAEYDKHCNQPKKRRKTV